MPLPRDNLMSKSAPKDSQGMLHPENQAIQVYGAGAGSPAASSTPKPRTGSSTRPGTNCSKWISFVMDAMSATAVPRTPHLDG